MGDRCTGHCCRAFTLNYDPESLRKMYTFEDGSPVPITPNSNSQVPDMVIYLGRHKDPPNGEPMRNSGVLFEHWYTCKHLSAEGNCGNYENRPPLCRDFPYKTPCPYSACDWQPETRPDVELRVLTKKLPRRVLTKYEVAEASIESIDLHVSFTAPAHRVDEGDGQALLRAEEVLPGAHDDAPHGERDHR